MIQEKIKDIVVLIKENLTEAKSASENNDLNYGEATAYAEVLEIIKDLCDEEEREYLGLNIDIDKTYLL